PINTPATASPCSSISSVLRAPAPRSPLFPYTTLFRSLNHHVWTASVTGSIDYFVEINLVELNKGTVKAYCECPAFVTYGTCKHRSEEHTSELQSRFELVCRLLLVKKRKRQLL